MRDYSTDHWLGYMNHTRASLTQALGDMISDMSQATMCALWHDGIEDAAPRVCYAVLEVGHAVEGGSLCQLITPDLARVLVGLAEILGHWVTLNMDADTPAYVAHEYRADAAP